jgi:thioredoxin-related protein
MEDRSLPLRRVPIFIAAVVASLVSAPQVVAQEVQWRTSYEVARREARETGRPIFVDIGNAACGWCRRLDASTFREPAVVRQLNERFIPLKIDADRHPEFVRALKVQSYPALAFASAEGKVLEFHEGFVDGEEFLRLCAAARANLPAPRLPTRPATPPPANADSETAAIDEVCRQLRERIAADSLAECEKALHADDVAKARQWLMRTLEMGADTAAAATARRHADRLQLMDH